jgi:PAS domain S-box-containing protein
MARVVNVQAPLSSARPAHLPAGAARSCKTRIKTLAHWSTVKAALGQVLDGDAITLGSPRRWSLWWSLGVAILAVATSVLVRVDFLEALGAHYTYVTFYPSVAIAAFVGGLPAGVLATGLAAIAVSLYIAPLATIADWVGLTIFLASCALTIGITEAMHRARARALQAEEDARLSGALRESEERFRTLVEQAPTAVAMFDRDMRYLIASRRWREDYQLKGDLLEKSHHEIFPDIPGPWREIQRRALSGESLRSEEHPFQRSDGRVQWLRWEVLPWRDAAGEVAGTVVFSDDITERMNAETTLRKNEEFVRGVLNSLPQEIAALDEKGVIVAVNEAWERFACENGGEPRAVSIGVNYLDICRAAANAGGPTAHEALCGLEALRAGTRNEFTLEYPCQSPDRTMWFMMHATRGPPGSDLIVCHIDITKQKLAEEALRDSEQKLRAVFEATDDAIIAIDENGLMQSVNTAAVGLFGYEARELVGRNVSMLMPEPYRSEHGQYVHNYLTTGKAKIIGIGREAEAVHRDGTIFPIELAVSEAARERPRLYVGVVRDITERKRAEKRQLELMEELKQSEMEAHQRHVLFRSIFNGTPEGMILTDIQRRIVMVNPALARMFGYEADELIGSSTSKLYARSEDWEEIGQAGSSSDDQPAALRPRIIRCRRKNGEVFPGEIIKVPYRDSSGPPFESLGIIRDVTWELRREEELREAQRLEALGQLTGGIAHDFNNLLTVISGNLQLLELKLEDKRLARYLGEAERAAEMGARLNQRLMTFARQRRLAPVATNLNEHVVDMRELLQRTIGENITVTIDLATGVWPVLVDPSEIESAILNLAINARDAMPNGGKLLIETENTVIDQAGEKTHEELTPGSYVRLSVSDTGSGMRPEVLARAFEPFFTTKEPGKGTGLGLSTIYGFVKQSGGHVTIYSEAGRGTTVNIYLPKLDTDEQAGLASEEAPALTAGAGETILVVEDNPGVRRLTIERLKLLNYRVLEADDAFSALTALETGEPVDLVFSDIVMPGMSGFELARKIRELRPSQRILLTSGFAGEIAHSGEHGVLDLPMLRKPYSQIELGRSIQAALKPEPREFKRA